MMRKLLKKLLFAFYLLVLTFTLLEVGVRLWGYSERHICDPIYMPFDRAQEIPYVHKPNLVNARARGLAVINTDNLGLRAMTNGDRRGARRGDEYRIAIVGDSVTFGEGVIKTEDTFPQVLEDTLNRKQSTLRVKVFNFGASAYSVQVMAAMLRYRMLDVEPDLVLMSIIPPDFDLSRTPSVDASGYFTDNKMSGFLSKDSSLRPLLRKVHLLYLLRDITYPRLYGTKNPEDILSAGGLPESYTYIKQFAATADQHRIACRIVLLPSRSRFMNVSAQLKRDNISFIDVAPLRDEFTPERFQASSFDPHPSAQVHRRIGESLAEHILENRLMASHE